MTATMPRWASMVAALWLALFWSAAAHAQQWYSASWTYAKAITIDSSKVSGGPLTNFPMLVNLSADASVAAHAQASGNDILFTASDGTDMIASLSPSDMAELEEFTAEACRLVLRGQFAREAFEKIGFSQDEIKTNVARVRELVAREDQVVQNQLTHLVEVKPSWFRRTTLRAVLWAIDLLAQRVYVHGTLGPIPTIHFARWVIIDGGRRLLFMSNFDGSWENYLGDFIDKAHTGLTGVWSNTDGFPPARWLIDEGATHERAFKDWTRAHQIPTRVWHSPSLTAVAYR